MVKKVLFHVLFGKTKTKQKNMPISQKHGGQKWKFCDKFLILLEATQKVKKKKSKQLLFLQS